MRKGEEKNYLIKLTLSKIISKLTNQVYIINCSLTPFLNSCLRQLLVLSVGGAHQLPSKTPTIQASSLIVINYCNITFSCHWLKSIWTPLTMLHSVDEVKPNEQHSYSKHRTTGSTTFEEKLVRHLYHYSSSKRFWKSGTNTENFTLITERILMKGPFRTSSTMPAGVQRVPCAQSGAALSNVAVTHQCSY